MKKIFLTWITCLLSCQLQANDISQALTAPFIYNSVNVISGEYTELQTDFKGEGAYSFPVRRGYTTRDDGKDGWHFNLPLIREDEEEKELSQQRILFNYDDNGFLKEALFKSQDQQSILLRHTVDFDEEKTSCQIHTQNGRTIGYRFEQGENSRFGDELLIKEVTINNQPICHYTYAPHPTERRKIITRREESSGQYIVNEYYKAGVNQVGDKTIEIKDSYKDPRVGMVMLQKGPIGPNGEEQIINRYFYHEGYTEVYDALNHKRVFRFNKQFRLTAVELFEQGEDGRDQLYSKEFYIWHLSGSLRAKGLMNAQGHALVVHTYDHDANGNVIKHSLFGNLTGKHASIVVLDDNGMPDLSCNESYSTYYEYSEGEKPLLTREYEDNGKEIVYNYDSGTNQLIQKIENNLLETSYRYNADGLLVETAVEDGSSAPRSTHTIYVEAGPAVGKPKEIQQLCSGTVQKRTVLSYDERGNLTDETTFNGSGNELNRVQYLYDSMDRPIGTFNQKGERTDISYDNSGNIAEKTSILENEKSLLQKNLYNQNNQLVHSKESREEGAELSTSYHYDLAGNKIRSTDIYGNHTDYVYDSLGRETRTIFPTVLNENGSPINPTVTQMYDIFNRVCTTVDTKGYRTHVEYNVRGKPVHVTFPDGSQETEVYNLDGSLAKKIARDDTATAYIYDMSGRITNEISLDINGEVNAQTTHIYNGFHKIASIDEKGSMISYSYDEVGQLYCVEKTNSKSLLKTTIERDEDGKVLRTRLEDGQGNCLKEINPKDECPSTPTPLNKAFDTITNELGQQVQRISVTDEKGITAITTLDALSRIVSLEKKGPMGETILQQRFQHDAAGNKTEENHTVFIGGSSSHNVINAWEYGPGNRLTAQIEAVGSICQKRTEYQYDDHGRFEVVIKPDGVTLTRKYDQKGKIKELYSSDGTIHYHYETANQAISVTDNLTTTTREYSLEGHLKQEHLGNGLTVSYTYDAAGRKTALHLPDKSAILYSYDSEFLKEVKRVNARGEETYKHSYLDFDTNGKLLQAELIDNLGKICFKRDKQGKPTAIETQYWSESLLWDEDRLVEIAINDAKGSFIQKYRYNSTNQLIAAEGDSPQSYDYDSLFNRVSHNGNAGTFNELNQLVSLVDTTFTYDANGNLVEERDGTTTKIYTYDALDRLTHVVVEGSTKVKMQYDPFNRRLSKKTFKWNANKNKWKKHHTERYLYDGEKEIGTVDANGEILTLRVLGIGLGAEIGATVAIEEHGTIYAPIHDHRGSIACLVDIKTGQPIETYRYSPFGVETIIDSEGNEFPSSTTKNNWRFSGKRYDSETGLIYFGQRYYSPATGRWITQDPLGFPDGPNRYAYVQNNPTSRLDLYGLFSFASFWNSFTDGMIWLFEATNYLVNSWQEEASYFNYVKPDFEYGFQAILGKYYLHMIGFYDDSPESGVYGNGELHDKVRITLINGILNARSDYLETLEHVSGTHGGINVHYIFRPTLGWTWDLIKSFCAKLGYVTPQARQLATTWKQLIQEMGGLNGDGLIVHYAHSIGGTDTYAAKGLLSPEEQKMIRVITIGSATLIPADGFQSVINYVSRRDGICLLDPISYLHGLIVEASHIIYIGTTDGMPLVDHPINTDTYWEIIEHLGQEFLDLCDSWGSM